MSPRSSQTLADRFCRLHGIGRDRFELAIIERTLDPKASALLRLLQLQPHTYFASDLELMRQLGEITSPEELEPIVAEFHAHPVSRRALRRRLRVRLSLRRLRRVVDQTFARTGPSSVRPSVRLTAA